MLTLLSFYTVQDPVSFAFPQTPEAKRGHLSKTDGGPLWLGCPLKGSVPLGAGSFHFQHFSCDAVWSERGKRPGVRGAVRILKFSNRLPV